MDKLIKNLRDMPDSILAILAFIIFSLFYLGEPTLGYTRQLGQLLKVVDFLGVIFSAIAILIIFCKVRKGWKGVIVYLSFAGVYSGILVLLDILFVDIYILKNNIEISRELSIILLIASLIIILVLYILMIFGIYNNRDYFDKGKKRKEHWRIKNKFVSLSGIYFLIFFLIAIFLGNLKSLLNLHNSIQGIGYLVGVLLTILLLFLFLLSIYYAFNNDSRFVRTSLLALWSSLVGDVIYDLLFFPGSDQNIKLTYTLLISAYILRSKFIEERFHKVKRR